MNIQDDSITNYLGDTLKELRYQMPPVIEDKCCHCGLVMRFPLVARKSDIDLFEMLLESAYQVMERHGITANLLADIKADCIISIASKGNK